jgi:dihydrofolate synthase/folylpolyglutamate synthase
VSAARGHWSSERAEEHLLGLELFGMRFGLDRMQRLMTALGSPQRSFRSIHVVGTNGKSSTARMAAALLTHSGLRAGAYLSPHLGSFAERIRIADRDLSAAAFGAAVQRAARAAEKVERTQGDSGERVTQFELLTAAAYSELAEQRVETAVIEAGLGGRYDATNVIPSEVVVLTNVGLEHTRWLGPTVRDIAREKLAVLRDGATLVVGEGLHPDAAEESRAAAAGHHAELVVAPPYTSGALAARGPFQRANFGMAMAAVGSLLGGLAPGAATAAAGEVTVPGRFEVVGERPLTVLDGAHNPGGMTALVAALDEVAGQGPLVAVVSILDDKDAPAMLASLLPRCSAAVFTASANPRALPPATLESLARQLAPALHAEVEPDPRAAVERARALAGPEGVVSIAGSIYLVADLKRSPTTSRASSL